MAEDDARRRTTQRKALAEHPVAPTEDLFDRIRRQAGLLAVAQEHRDDRDALGRAIAQAFHEDALASDHVLTVSGPVDAATLGWLSPVGILALLVMPGCTDRHVVEHVAAALAAMNGVALAVDEPQHSRLRPLLRSLDRFLPEAFTELEPGPQAVYPIGSTVLVLTPDVLYRTASAPIALPRPGRTLRSRLDLLALYSRIREVDVVGRRRSDDDGRG